MSQADLARAVGVTRPAVSKWENGDTENLKLSNIVKLCQIFQLSADELIGGCLATERHPGAYRHAINEPTPAYRVREAYRMPDHLAKSCAGLNEDGRRLVEAQIEVAIETALRVYGHRAASKKNAA